MELNFYRHSGRCFVSDRPDLPLEHVEKPPGNESLIWLFSRKPQNCRAAFCVSDIRQLAADQENICFLDPARLSEIFPLPPRRLMLRVDARILPAVNVQHPQWEALTRKMQFFQGGKLRVHLLAVGDVGGTLLIGLKLLGGDCISTIGICDLSEKTVARWTAELGQVSWPWNYDALPAVEPVTPEHLFDCDIFVFAATRGIPPVGSAVKDVRMAQLHANREIVETYAKQARAAHFPGLFCVMSDPVDPLCKAAYLASNADKSGKWDGRGLLPEQIQGFGLGVMNARAADLAKRTPAYRSFLEDGRAFGPHGQGLVIANSIKNYDDGISQQLTQEVLEANLHVRELGFKPYIAPALSSGTMQLLLLMRGHWHCSSVPLGNIWFGCRNRITRFGLETENLSLPDALFSRLRETEALLHGIL